jgi:transposase-like protein
MANGSGGGASAAAVKWAQRLEMLQQSGLSVRKFAEREGLKAGSLSFWKWKLEQQKAGGVPRVAPLRFVELTAEEPTTETAPPRPRGSLAARASSAP